MINNLGQHKENNQRLLKSSDSSELGLFPLQSFLSTPIWKILQIYSIYIYIKKVKFFK